MFNPAFINSLKTFELYQERKPSIDTKRPLRNDSFRNETAISKKTQQIFALKVKSSKHYPSPQATATRLCEKEQINPEQQEMNYDDSPIYRKLPTIHKMKMTKISSFLLGLTSRIEKEYQIRKSADLEERSKEAKKMINDLKIKIEHPNKSQVRSEIKKRTHQISNISDIIEISKPRLINEKIHRGSRKIAGESLPHLQNKAITSPQYNSIKEVPLIRKPQSEEEATKRRSVKLPENNSSKLLPLSPTKPTFKKGYLHYIEGGKQFLESHREYISYFPKQGFHFPDISANNYFVINRRSLKVIAHRKPEEFIEIASLTKIMTCFLALLVCKKYEVNPAAVNVKVSEKAAAMVGTSAQLERGDILRLEDLFYGLMLPSGNDASVAIAETVGKIINKFKIKPSKRNPYDLFINHMNILASELSIEQTYENPSGLQANPNFSTPKAVTLLAALAMQNQQFCKIVNTKQYDAMIKNECSGLIRKSTWRNTNKLLWKEGWCGVKTGTTEAAGHCLMACKGDYLISVYDCSTLSRRFTECNKLYEYLHKLNKLT